MRNSMSRGNYLYFSTLLMISATLLYRNTLFLSIRGLDTRQSQWVLIILTVVMFIAGIAFTLRRHRTYMNMYCNLGLPFALYTFLSCGSRKSVPALLWLAAGIGGVLCALLLVLFLADRDNKKTKRVCIWMALRIRNVMAAVLGAALVSCALLSAIQRGNILARSDTSPSIKPAYSVFEHDEFEESLDDVVSLLQKEERTVKETHALLQMIANSEAAYWGLPYTLTVEITPLKNCVLGQYDHSEHLIQINESALELSTQELLQTILHECYHCVQAARVDAWKQVSPELRSARFFQSEYVWDWETEHYISASKEGYSDQWLEDSANIYADVRMQECYYEFCKGME